MFHSLKCCFDSIHILFAVFFLDTFDEEVTMKLRHHHLHLLLLLLCCSSTETIEPISTSIAVGVAAALTGYLARYQNIFHYFQECCRPEWISFNKTGKHMYLLHHIYAGFFLFSVCMYLIHVATAAGFSSLSKLLLCLSCLSKLNVMLIIDLF